MNQAKAGQVVSSAAEIYEEFFVPALFRENAGRVVDVVRVQVGQSVLDVACGTGILARTMAGHVGASGFVTGLDVNEGMLAVAQRKAPGIQWRQGRAESLPFEDDSFDAVVSQFGLMFFEDRKASIEEMVRVLRPGGRLAVAVWASLDATPGYVAMVNLLERLFGSQVADGLRMPYVLGDVEEFRRLFDSVDLQDARVETLMNTARFPSIESWVYTDIKGWVLSDAVDDTQFDTLVGEATQELSRFVKEDGRVAFDAPAHVFTAVKGLSHSE